MRVKKKGVLLVGSAIALLLVAGAGIAVAAGVDPAQSSNAPSATADPTQDLPTCVPVSGGTNGDVGCVLKSQLQASPDERDALDKEYPVGLPVYDSEAQSKQTGWLTPDGFVPLSLTDRVSDIAACTNEAHKVIASRGTDTPQTLSSACRDLLIDQGAPPSVLDSGKPPTAASPTSSP